MRLNLAKLNIDWPDASPVVRYNQVGVYPKNRQGRLRLAALGIQIQVLKKAKAWSLEPIWDFLDVADTELDDELWFATIGPAKVDSTVKRTDWPMIEATRPVHYDPYFMPNGYAVEIIALRPGPGSAILILSTLGEGDERA